MGKNNSLEKTLSGVLHFHSETGTEGGHWAFQDFRCIQKNVPSGFCKNCGNYIGDVYKRNEGLNENPTCKDGAHEEGIRDAWSYDGLHILKDGDRLIIYHPNDNKEIWSGVINLKQYPLFTEHVFGMWIHADQIGIKREVWAEYFFQEYPADLIPVKK